MVAIIDGHSAPLLRDGRIASFSPPEAEQSRDADAGKVKAYDTDDLRSGLLKAIENDQMDALGKQAAAGDVAPYS